MYGVRKENPFGLRGGKKKNDFDGKGGPIQCAYYGPNTNI